MKKTDKISYREKSIAQLEQLALDLRKKIVEASAKQASGNIKDTSVFKKYKKEIAYISTIVTQKNNEQKSS